MDDQLGRLLSSDILIFTRIINTLGYTAVAVLFMVAARRALPSAKPVMWMASGVCVWWAVLYATFVNSPPDDEVVLVVRNASHWLIIALFGVGLWSEWKSRG
jgi:hypothetical protein